MPPLTGLSRLSGPEDRLAVRLALRRVGLDQVRPDPAEESRKSQRPEDRRKRIAIEAGQFGVPTNGMMWRKRSGRPMSTASGATWQSSPNIKCEALIQNTLKPLD